METPPDAPPKRPAKRVYHMAFAATVTLHDATGKALATLRYGRMPQADADELVTALADDVMTLLMACPALLVVLLCDGAKERWNRLETEFNPRSLGHPLYRLVDLWHLLEKLGSAARLLYGEAQGAAVLFAWRLQLLNQEEAVESLLTLWNKAAKSTSASGTAVPCTRPSHIYRIIARI